MNYSTAADASSAASTKPSGITHIRVVMSALELAALAYLNVSAPPPDFLGPGTRLTVHVVDPDVPGESVLLRGPGLNFFNYMALVTTAAAAASPAHPVPTLPPLWRQTPPDRHNPLVLTDELIANFRKRANSRDGSNLLGEIRPLVAKEVEMFLAALHGSPREAQLLDEFDFAKANRCQRLTGLAAWLPARGRRAGHALERRGTLKDALDVMRSLRNELWLIVDHDRLPSFTRWDHLDRWYTPLNAFPSMGPPRQGIEQLDGAEGSGYVNIIGPRLEVWAEDRASLAQSPGTSVPGSTVRVTTIRATLPEPSLRKAADDLLTPLLKRDQPPHALNS
ncbi:hypothetical protein DL764_004922 [Monosporascus ibericus]|uniref:Uncharacterized protein n=1 Tax=Monosporascus ibericus TaxID=155417 RepID=A0A4Q4TEB9_9PEZI|nr:hypothetical protein DL764_004922 [Monosporascus ibericus]